MFPNLFVFLWSRTKKLCIYTNYGGTNIFFLLKLMTPQIYLVTLKNRKLLTMHEVQHPESTYLYNKVKTPSSWYISINNLMMSDKIIYRYILLIISDYILLDGCINTFTCVSQNSSFSTRVSRLGVRPHHPSGSPSQVVGAGREDVPHQPKTPMDANETARPAEDGRSQKGSEKETHSEAFLLKWWKGGGWGMTCNKGHCRDILNE